MRYEVSPYLLIGIFAQPASVIRKSIKITQFLQKEREREKISG